MKIITQLNLFEEQELGDLEKILMVLDGLPETDLFERLEAKRKHGRKDYSVQSYFIAYIAKFILQLETDQQLLRQLRMNSQLRQICGFETHGVKLKNGTTKLVNCPSPAAYSRFLRDLSEVFPEVEEWVEKGVVKLYELLPDFGKEVALDGKIIGTYASPYGQGSKKRKDNRADLEADFTIKEKYEGNKLIKKETYYGFRCHLLVDAKYELPIAWKVTPASAQQNCFTRVVVPADCAAEAALVPGIEVVSASSLKDVILSHPYPFPGRSARLFGGLYPTGKGGHL